MGKGVRTTSAALKELGHDVLVAALNVADLLDLAGAVCHQGSHDHGRTGTLLSVVKGTSTITESVWDNRFRYVDELRKMGAVVQVDGQVAVFELCRDGFQIGSFCEAMTERFVS